MSSTLAWRVGGAGGLIVSFACYAWLGTRNPHVGFLADDALYLLMAEILSPYREAMGAVYGHVARYSQLPPFFPLLLAFAGAGPDHLLPARLVTAACMAAAWFVALAWFRQRGLSRPLALASALFCAFTPVTLLYASELWSEGLYVGLALLALLFEGALSRRPSLVAVALLGVLVGCALETRSIGLALIPALSVGLWRRRGAAVPVFLLAVALTYAAFAPLDMGAAAPSYPALMVGHYVADPVAAATAQLDAAFARLPAAALYEYFLLRDVTPWQGLALGLIGLCVLRGLWRELRERSVAGIYVVTYLGIVLVWPFPDHLGRFLYPLLPWLCLFAWRGASARWPVAGAVPLALAALLAAPGLYALAGRAMTPVPAAGFDDFRMTRYWLDASRQGDVLDQMAGLRAHLAASERVASQVDADACVYTTDIPLVLLHGRRPAFLPPPAARMAQGPPWGCAYFLLSSQAAAGRPAFYPLDFLRQHATGLALVRRDGDDPQSPPVALLMRVR